MILIDMYYTYIYIYTYRRSRCRRGPRRAHSWHGTACRFFRGSQANWRGKHCCEVIAQSAVQCSMPSRCSPLLHLLDDSQCSVSSRAPSMT